MLQVLQTSEKTGPELTPSSTAEFKMQGLLRVSRPCDGVATDLQKLEELLGLFSVSVFLFSSKGVIGNQQRVGPSS